jgi:two-component system sensor histidine kinase/response regulator
MTMDFDNNEAALNAHPLCRVALPLVNPPGLLGNEAFRALFFNGKSPQDSPETAWPAPLLDLLTDSQHKTNAHWHVDLYWDNKTWRVYSQKVETPAPYLSWLFTDVSDLQKAAHDAHNLSEMKSLFLATMSHEIRTPLQPIYGLLEIMSQQTDDPELLDTIGAARTSASQLLLILDDVLDLAKVDAGKMELDRFEVPLRTLIDGVVTTLGGKAREKNIRLEYTTSNDVPAVVQGDPKRLRQVLLNLTSNALKFTSTGSVQIRVSATPLPGDRNTLIRFEVIDTGVGLSSEQQVELFNPFHQADRALSRKLGGTGLGLSICARLVELFGGHIGVESTLGKGSTFWFTLPTQAVTTDIAIASQQTPDLSGLLILSVEDHPQGAKSIQLSLESMGATVDSVGTSEEAIHHLTQQRYDIAIVDQGLPDGDGLALMRAAAKQNAGLGLILYTVFDTPEIQQSLKTIGGRYLSKPASRLGLGQTIAEIALKVHYNPAASRRVLFIEDTPSIRDVLQRQLKFLDFTDYDMCESGAEAFELLEKNTYGLIICDLHMPDMDGFEVVRRILAAPALADTPVIALTADVTVSQGRLYSKHGFREYLLKPISVDQLRRVLVRWGILMSGKPAEKPQPQQQLPSLKHLNLSALQQHYGRLDDEVLRSLQLFVRLSGAMLSELRRGVTEQNTYIVRSVAHSLKGSALIAQCLALANLAGDLQQRAAEGSLEYEGLPEKIALELENISLEVAGLNMETINVLLAAATPHTAPEPARPTAAPVSITGNPGTNQTA